MYQKPLRAFFYVQFYFFIFLVLCIANYLDIPIYLPSKIPKEVIDSKFENVKAQMRKGVLELCTLALLKNGDAYSSDLIQRLREGDMIVVEGTLYPLLTRLKNLDLLTYRWEESKSGPPRKYYSLTQKGHESLNEMQNAWTELVNSVNQFLNPEKP